MLTDSKQVANRLTRMLPVRKGVDHGDRYSLSHAIEHAMSVHPGHYGCYVAIQDLGQVLHRLAAVQV